MSFHNIRDSKGRFKKVSGPEANVPITQVIAGVPTAKPKLKNHIAILLDSSGSIANRGLTNKMIEAYNKQVATIKEQAHNSGQETYVSLWKFGEWDYNSNAYLWRSHNKLQIKRELFATHHEAVPFLTNFTYNPHGNTPLVHCIEYAIKELQGVKDANDPNTSFLLIVITDGEDTESDYVHKRQVRALVDQMTNMDRWTFTCAGPQIAKGPMLELGFPEGNLHLWEQTARGAESMGFAAAGGTQAYYGARAVGQMAVKNFYTTNLTNVDPKAIAKLQDFNNKFHRFTITPKDCPGVNQNGKQAVEISEFIKARGLNYQVSKAFYELTKTEEVQDHKELAIVNKDTGTIYGGHEAKDLLKLPKGGTIKVKPGDHANYKVFVQSTSMNRKLLAGTEVLYRNS